MELGNSIRNRRHCSPVLLSDQLHEALHDLNIALKSQPRLFLGRSIRNHHATNMLALAAATAKHENHVSLSTVKTDNSALLDWKNKRASSFEKAKETERKFLRPTLSKIASTSLEFSEALPFAAFASLLVEMVAKLDNIIEEVEELGRIGCFKEFEPGDDQIIVKCEPVRDENAINLQNHLPSHGAD